ncbi:hypothetical protein D3C73_459180 [compost metagenome]
MQPIIRCVVHIADLVILPGCPQIALNAQRIYSLLQKALWCRNGHTLLPVVLQRRPEGVERAPVQGEGDTGNLILGDLRNLKMQIDLKVLHIPVIHYCEILLLLRACSRKRTVAAGKRCLVRQPSVARDRRCCGSRLKRDQEKGEAERPHHDLFFVHCPCLLFH